MLRQTRNQFSAKHHFSYKKNVICCAELTAQSHDNNYAVLPLCLITLTERGLTETLNSLDACISAL